MTGSEALRLLPACSVPRRVFQSRRREWARVVAGAQPEWAAWPAQAASTAFAKPCRRRSCGGDGLESPGQPLGWRSAERQWAEALCNCARGASGSRAERLMPTSNDSNVNNNRSSDRWRPRQQWRRVSPSRSPPAGRATKYARQRDFPSSHRGARGGEPRKGRAPLVSGAQGALSHPTEMDESCAQHFRRREPPWTAGRSTGIHPRRGRYGRTPSERWARRRVRWKSTKFPFRASNPCPRPAR